MIEETISLITDSENLSPSSGDNLDGMEIDIEHCFSESDVFNLASLATLKDNGCMFKVALSVNNHVNELHEVRQSLLEAWEFIAYNYYGASSVQISRESGFLRFVTVIGHGQFYVTGKVVVCGEKYEKLAANA